MTVFIVKDPTSCEAPDNSSVSAWCIRKNVEDASLPRRERSAESSEEGVSSVVQAKRAKMRGLHDVKHKEGSEADRRVKGGWSMSSM